MVDRLLGPLTCEQRPETPWPAFDPTINDLECLNCGQPMRRHWTTTFAETGCSRWMSPRKLDVGMSEDERAWWTQHLAERGYPEAR